MQTVEQRHLDAARALADYAGFQFAADHLDMAISATAEAFARFEASLPPSAPVDQEEIEEQARQLLADACGWKDAPHCREWIDAVAEGELSRISSTVGVSIALRAVQAALALPPSGIAEMVLEMCAGIADMLLYHPHPDLNEGEQAWNDACCRISADIRSLDLPGIADAWQPIETAPDDLSNFLVGWVGRHTVKIATFNAAGRLVELEDFAGWIEGGEPTHWRPLPVPPADLSNKGVG